MIRGNPGKRAARELALSAPAVPAAAAPIAPPKWLSPGALEHWDEIVELVTVRRPVADSADATALGMLAETLAEYATALAAAAENPFYETQGERGASLKRAHPAVAQVGEASRRLASQLAAFGLTPADRERVTLRPPESSTSSRKGEGLVPGRKGRYVPAGLPGLAYARKVAAGKITAGKYVRLACLRHCADLERWGCSRNAGGPYYFDASAAEEAIEFAGLFHHYQGEFAGRPLVFEPWQAFVFAP